MGSKFILEICVTNDDNLVKCVKARLNCEDNIDSTVKCGVVKFVNAKNN